MIDILLVEDNKELSDLMNSFLVCEGYQVHCVYSGEEAEKFLKTQTVKLILLDIMLPGMDGFSLCHNIREKKNTPIIVLSARVDKESKMNGFIQGADDYIEKPVDIDILNAKIAAIFKRYYNNEEKQTQIEVGDVVLNEDSMEVFYQGERINLTVKEYDLLYLLLKNKGKTLSKEYLFAQVWGNDSFSENQTLTVHIKMLRNKLEENPKKPKNIVTVWGVGYRYEEV